MPIKPVDYQVMLPRTSEAARIQSDIRNRDHIINQHQSMEVSQKADESLKQVYSKDKAHETGIRDRQEKGRGQSHTNEKHAKNKKNHSELVEMEDEIKSTTIDIRL